MAQFKAAIVIYESVSGDMSRVYRGLKTALELVQAGDEVTVLFDGSGVETLAAISDPASPLHGLADALKANIQGGCSFCATSHKVEDAIKAAGWPLLADYNGEASFRKLLVDGYQVFNF